MGLLDDIQKDWDSLDSKRGLVQRIADDAHLSREHVSRILNGHAENCTVSTAENVSQALKTIIAERAETAAATPSQDHAA